MLKSGFIKDEKTIQIPLVKLTTWELTKSIFIVETAILYKTHGSAISSQKYETTSILKLEKRMQNSIYQHTSEHHNLCMTQ